MTSQETVDTAGEEVDAKSRNPDRRSLADELLVDSDEAENAPDDDDDTSDRQEWGGTHTPTTKS